MIAIRRTYQCKLGHAGPAVEIFREVNRLALDADSKTRAVRIYTDLSGGCDRVVVETERCEWEHPRGVSAQVHGHPDAPVLFGRLREYITTASVEYFEIEESL